MRSLNGEHFKRGDFVIYSDETSFLLQAREHQARTETSAQFVDFQTIYPTYLFMNRMQERWYFYWRTEARQGTERKTSLSYIYTPPQHKVSFSLVCKVLLSGTA